MIEIVHFVLGGNFNGDSIFALEPLIDHSFSIELDLNGASFIASRSGREPRKIFVEAESAFRWPVSPTVDDASGKLHFAEPEWTSVLGGLFFGLPTTGRRDKYSPTFRSLVSFLARKEPEGFINPHSYFSKASRWLWQVALSYLLGFDASLSQEWQEVRDKEDSIKKIKKEIGDGVLSDIIRPAASLRSEIAIAQREVNDIAAKLSDFVVHPQYRKIEEEVNDLNCRIKALLNDNVIDRQSLSRLSGAQKADLPATTPELRGLFDELRLTLPDIVQKRYEDVVAFHASVVRNRQLYLQQEEIDAKSRISDRDDAIRAMDLRRSDLMAILSKHGALEHFMQLQVELTRHQSHLESLKAKYDTAMQLEGRSSKLTIARQELLIRLRQDLAERSDTVNSAITRFAEISSRLYSRPATLQFAETDNGLDVHILAHGDRSSGLSNMQIFTFDVMLSSMISDQHRGPGFLIHDSHLFDPVDARQVGMGITVGCEYADRHGFQYIVTMNSDKLHEAEYPENFDINDYTLDARLSDDRENGGLFGIRFD